MPEETTLDQLLARNPSIDKSEVERIRKLRDQLQRSGKMGDKYRLASPVTHRRVSVQGDARTTSRCAHAKRRP